MTQKKSHILISLCLNIIIVVLEIIALRINIDKHGIKVFCFYTQNSNYLALLSSLIFSASLIPALIKNKPIPRFADILRFLTNIGLSVTLFVVLFVLIPIRPENTTFMLFENSNLFQHLICPLLSLVSFLAFENPVFYSKSTIPLGLAPTFVYGVACLALNLTKVIEGPYPFFYVYKFPWYLSVLFLISVFAVTFTITITLFFIKNKIAKMTHKK